MFPLLIPAALLGTAWYVSRPAYKPFFGAAGTPQYPQYGPPRHMPLSRAEMVSQYGSMSRGDVFFDEDEDVSLFSTDYDSI